MESEGATITKCRPDLDGECVCGGGGGGAHTPLFYQKCVFLLNIKCRRGNVSQQYIALIIPGSVMFGT